MLRRRVGFALAESVLALVLLGSGALALVVATAASIRAIEDADAQLAAVIAARNRVELLAARECEALRDGSAMDSSSRLREWWRVGVGSSPTRFVTDSVEYFPRAGRRAVAMTGRLVSC